ncbi:ornithine cyclodeaminase family protein [Streptomyces sp. NPDC098077]|uniref:ornithine cyclodeaminase family protein n=1 Tax=Streptomyces sp. NPDC098077 TaxID=3366093 RepID=UPI0038225D66
MTRILTRTDLLRLLEPGPGLDALRDGFLLQSPGKSTHKTVAALPFPGVATALLPGVLPGIEAWTVKINAKFPGADPALRGLVCLHGGRDGELLAVLDSATITSWRTGLSAALAIDALAPVTPSDELTLGVIGAGAQAYTTLAGLAHLRVWQDLLVHDIVPERASILASHYGGRTAACAADVAASADVVLLATWPTRPVLRLSDTRPAQHLTSLGSDEQGKRELAADLLNAAAVIVDDLELARSFGVLSAPGAPLQACTLKEVLTSSSTQLRTDRRQRTVYAPVGMPWQDLALSWLLHRAAEEQDIGTLVDWLS